MFVCLYAVLCACVQCVCVCVRACVRSSACVMCARVCVIVQRRAEQWSVFVCSACACACVEFVVLIYI